LRPGAFKLWVKLDSRCVEPHHTRPYFWMRQLCAPVTKNDSYVWYIASEA
jgi:hypothetical protein